MDIIASGPHNKTPMVRLSPRLQAQRLAGMAPPPPRSVVSSFRTISGLGKTKKESLEDFQRADQINRLLIWGLGIAAVVVLVRAGKAD